MRILYASDLHLEFRQLDPLPAIPDPSTYDLVILAGDVSTAVRGATWAIETFSGKPIIYIPGNHEYYGYDFNLTNAAIGACEELDENFHALLPGSIFIGDTQFIGATLWTDGNDPTLSYQPYSYIERHVNDFQLIKVGDRRWRIEDAQAAFEQHRAFIESQLQIPWEGNRVVITHFLPTRQAIAKKYENSNLNGYFASDLDDLIAKYKPTIWLFGHTHDPQQFVHSSGETVMLANPWGYPRENPGRQWKIFEIEHHQEP
jgi:predicted phosphodiesterase